MAKEENREPPYDQLFQAMPCYISIQNRDLRIIEANDKFKRDFGTLNGRHCFEVYKGRTEKCEVCPVEQSFADGLSHRSEERVRTRDGREVSVIVYSSPVKDQEGRVTSVMEVSTDVTEIKALEEKLRMSEQRYRLLFDRVPCYITVQDPELNVIEANQRFIEDFGRPETRKCYEVYKHRREECLHCPVQETLRDGGVHHSEEVVASLDGDRINTLVYTAPILDTEGNIDSVMEMSTNITPIRELQSQLESVGLLISSISHGIKGLLNGLDGGMYLVNTGLKKNNPERLSKGWEMVQRNVDRIRSQVMNILYYAKERVPQWERLNGGEIGAEVFKVLEAKAKELGVMLRYDAAEDAGAFDGDPQAIRAMLINLLENSLDACRVDSRKTVHRVTFEVTGTEDEIRFMVADNGIGMDRETRDKAASLFFTSKGAKGTGLGLFIANKITTAHGGRITVDSELDRGACFLVSIPRRRTIETLEKIGNKGGRND